MNITYFLDVKDIIGLGFLAVIALVSAVMGVLEYIEIKKKSRKPWE